MHKPLIDLKTTQTRFGTMTYAAGDYYIGKSLELYGEYSWAEVELIAKLAKPDWTIINGGANIGALTIPIAELVPEGRVYAFEPQPEIFDILEKNVERFNAQSRERSEQHILNTASELSGERSERHSDNNLTVSDYALWSLPGTTRMRYLAELEHPNLGALVINDEGGSHIANTTTLDIWLQGEKVDLIFLDIEGCEVDALRGARETIAKYRPILYVEDHPDYNSSVKSYVHSLNYFIYEHRPPLFTPQNWKGYRESHFGDTISCNSLCIPKERLEEFRHVIDDQTKFILESLGSKLTMSLPRKSTKLWAGIARCGGVGDNLIAASPARALKELGYNVEVITQNPQSVVFENNPFIDKISVYDAADWPPDLVEWQKLFRMRAKEYGKFANLSHSVECRHGLLPIQTWYWWPQDYRRKLCSGSYLETAHDVMGVPHSFGPLFFPTDEEKEQAAATRKKLGDRPIVGWTLSGTRVDKVYPFAALLIARLIKELGVQVVMMGGPPPYRDLELARGIEGHVRAQNGSVDGLVHAASPSMDNQTWPIRRLLTFAAQCDLVIGPDTGPSWSVAFEPVPKIIMVSHTSEENITKHWVNTTTLHANVKRVPCWPCHRLHDSFDTCKPVKVSDTGNEFAACMNDISVEEVMLKAAKLLTPTVGGSTSTTPH